MKQLITISLFLSIPILGHTQENKPLKIQHAEPLYIDLMRDLGAHKGEAEFNLGFGMANHTNYYEYNGFIEYEWAVANRLGLEIEIPFSFNKGIGTAHSPIPNNKIEGIKLATQYTFMVNEKYQTSMAIGYLHEFEMNSFQDLGKKNQLFEGMKMNPIFVAAKKINNIHTLLYTGPVIQNHFENHHTELFGMMNASVHYVIPNQKHFIGIENNMEIHKGYFHYTMRPQMKVQLVHNFAIGILTGIPITNNDDVKMDFMTRIIWEP